MSDEPEAKYIEQMKPEPKRQWRHAEALAALEADEKNWPAILEAGREAGTRWYIVEQDRCYDRDPFDSLKISYDNLKAMGLS